MERSRFGELALDAGFLTQAQLDRALDIREQDIASGATVRPLAIICVEEGFMTFQRVVATIERGERTERKTRRPAQAPTSRYRTPARRQTAPRDLIAIH